MFVGFSIFVVAAFGIQIAKGGVAKNNEEYIPIKYPGPIQEVSKNHYGTPESDIPNECRNQNFCTIKPPDYPQKNFNEMFEGTKPVPELTLVKEDTLAIRQGDPDEIDDCASTVSYEPLYKVRSKRGDWRTVVQAPEENYVQTVRLETCNKPGSACFTAFPEAPNIQTFCEQKYSVWEFLVATENNGTERVQAELPICCSCHYKFI